MPKIIISLLCLFSPLFLRAETPEEKGLNIALEIDRRGKGYEDIKSSLKMILKNRSGQETTRSMRSKILEGPQTDGDKTVMIFDHPRDVKGTALLSYSHKKKADDQWLYLPALKRIKRISAANRSGPFMGSEFAYEDISPEEVEKYTYKYIEDVTIDKKLCFKVERYPTYPKSGYTKQVVYVDSKRYIPLKIDFYDRKKTLLKTLRFKSYKLYLKKYWRPDLMHMVNLQNRKETRLLFKNYVFKSKLRPSAFTRNALKRAR